MKKVPYLLLGLGIILLGLGIAISLGYAVCECVIHPMQRASGKSPESYLGICWLIVTPLCLTLGSLLSGYLIQPFMKRRSIPGYLLISPGLYLALAFLYPEFLDAGDYTAYIADLTFFIICSVEWTIASVVGVRFGVFLRDRRSQESNNHSGPNVDSPAGCPEYSAGKML